MKTKASGGKPATKPSKPRVAANTRTSHAAAKKMPNTPAPTKDGKKTSGGRAKAPQAGKPSVATHRTELARDSKQSRLIAMLRVPSGATIKQMMALTGWQAHTIRGTISGALRKKLGLNVISERSDESDERRYRIVGSPASA